MNDAPASLQDVSFSATGGTIAPGDIRSDGSGVYIVTVTPAGGFTSANGVEVFLSSSGITGLAQFD